MISIVKSSYRHRLAERGQQYYQRWLRRRIPPAKTLTLNQKRIFIFPSRTGFFFLLVLLLILIAAINYQNNMTFALTFLLANVFVIAILHTFINLSGLTVSAVRASSVYAGQQSEFEIKLSHAGKRPRFALTCHWQDALPHTVNLDEKTEVTIKTYLDTGKRGWFNPGRLLIETCYPLGLLRAWTWIDLDIQALVYPNPLPCEPLKGQEADAADGSTVPVEGSDDFYGLRDYIQGDSLKHVFWKTVAKAQPLQTKQYNAYADQSVWLDWQSFSGLPVEQCLSHLCYWLLQFERSHEDYGLRLPGVTIEPNRGEAHKDLLLRHLALFDFEASDTEQGGGVE